MSTMKNGFSTLNRWLGKKNKDKTAAPNGKLSKSSTNLSVSSTNINETSQLEYNRITPLPVATSNAPFEQTFRITVLLPKDQLYVARLGARVPLSKLLELVTEHKQLDAEKYEFRNPVDPSQVYSCDLTIGTVGLSEIRLCHKSESYDTFNADEVIKLHRTSLMRDSLSSSEFSSRNSKHTTKTSPYSSSNSLNSMDSAGVNYVRTPVSPQPPALPTSAAPKMTAPPRKKRAAPRPPPSQIVIPEKSALVIENADVEQTIEMLKAESPMPRKDYYSSTPNLASSTLLSNEINGFDCNGNSTISPSNHNGIPDNDKTEDSNYIDPDVAERNSRNLYVGGSVQNLTTMSTQELPEPSPRKRVVQIKKKTAPAPPPRGSSQPEDTISIASSTTPSIPGTPLTPHEGRSQIGSVEMNESVLITKVIETPKPAVREVTIVTKPAHGTVTASPSTIVESLSPTSPEKVTDSIPNLPKPIPRSTTMTLLNASTDLTTDMTTTASTTTTTVTTITQQQHTNVSKVILNRTPTPEPRSLSSEPPEIMDSGLETQLTELNHVTNCDEDDNISKQADSGIGEPVPSPVPDSLQSEGSAHECKSTFESSSDDDDMIKVYNFKLGKTVIKSSGMHKTNEELTLLAAAAQTDSSDNTPIATEETTPNISETTSWNFSIPISPPPNFADSAKLLEKHESEKIPDTPITPKIKERPILNFEVLTTENVAPGKREVDVVDRTAVRPVELRMESQKSKNEQFVSQKLNRASPLSSPSTPMSDIVDELSTIIQEKRIDSLIKKAENQHTIEAAKPNTLSNFSITTISQQTTKPTEILCNGDAPAQPTTPDTPSDEEKLYRKRGSITGSNNVVKQRKSVTRSDSFHTTTVMQSQHSTKSETTAPDQTNGLNSRSSSYLSLTKIEQNGLNLNRRRSSSELSIGESPSLQSVEIIKTILNSRKNSLANSSDGESKPISSPIVNHIEEKRTRTEEVKITIADTKPKKEETVRNTIETVVQRTVEKPVEKTSEKPQTVANVKPATDIQKPKEVPKAYRYSGPPSINFSTWSERPKIQVAIKNEGDYIFGGKSADSPTAAVTTAALEINTNSMPRNYRASTPANAFKIEMKTPPTVSETRFTPNTPPPAVAPKPDTILRRMGIEDKEYHVPITVKPLRDVIVESPVPKIEVMSSVTTIKFNVKPKEAAKPEVKRPVSMVYSSSTIPRSGNRFSVPASAPAPNPKVTSIPSPALLRSTSITKLEATKPKSAPVEETTPAAPFGQNTLRKTGLKEKILAKEQAEKEEQKTTVVVSQSAASPSQPLHQHQRQNSTTITTNGIRKNTVTVNSTPNTTKTLQSAKLELKLQKSTNVFLNQTSPTITTTPTTPKTIKTVTTPVGGPQPPPPPPPTMTITLKSAAGFRSGSNSSTPTPTSSDPRDQLLEAIRNFKRDELNRT